MGMHALFALVGHHFVARVGKAHFNPSYLLRDTKFLLVDLFV